MTRAFARGHLVFELKNGRAGTIPPAQSSEENKAMIETKTLVKAVALTVVLATAAAAVAPGIALARPHHHWHRVVHHHHHHVMMHRHHR